MPLSNELSPAVPVSFLSFARIILERGILRYKYNDAQKMTVLGRSSISDALVNFLSSSSFPMARTAAAICRSSSPSRRKTLIKLPSNTSTNCRKDGRGLDS